MEVELVKDLLSDLSANLDDLEAALEPVTSAPLSASSTKLPLLDKAKLYVLATYSIETLLFNYLRINGVDAKNHPVFQELSRVKNYFAKIQHAENPHAGKGRVDTAAAGRLVKHGLAGNDRYDQNRQMGVGAKRKLDELSTGTHTKFDARHAEQVQVVKADELTSDDEVDSEGEAEDAELAASAKPHGKKRKERRQDQNADAANAQSQSEKDLSKKAKKRKKKGEALETQ